MQNQSILIKLFKNSLVLFSGNSAANICGLISLVLLTRSLGAELFGYYTLAFAMIEIVDRLLNFQTWPAFIKFGANCLNDRKKHRLISTLKYCFYVDLVTLTFSLIICITLGWYALAFFEVPSELRYPLMFFTILIPCKIADLSTGIFRLFDQFKTQAKVIVFGAVIKLVLFLAIYHFGPTFELFIYATIFSQFAMLWAKIYFSYGILTKQKISLIKIINHSVDKSFIKHSKLLPFVIYSNIDSSIRLIPRQIDVVILAKMFGAEIVGIYKLAKEIALMMAQITEPIYQAIFPEFAKLLSEGKQLDAKQIGKRIAVYAGLLGVVLLMCFGLLGQMFLALLFDGKFALTYEVTLLYMIAVVIGMYSLPLPPMAHSLGLAKELFKVQLISTVLYLVCLWPLILNSSLLGAAGAMIVYHTLWLILAHNLVYRNLRVK